MSRTFSKLRVFTCAAIGSLFLGLSGPSTGAAFQVNFDPTPPDLFGIAVFDLTAPCLAHDGDYNTFYELLGLGIAGCTVSLESASISTTGPGGPFADYIAELPYVLFSELLIVNHQLAGLTTLFPIRLEPDGGGNLLAAVWTSGFTQGEDCDATLSFTVSGGVTFTGCGPNGPTSPLGAHITSITQVPEPGTLALLLGGGLAGWWVRRRRSRA
jgi:hypothetical protein